MLVRFTLENWMSFRDPVEFSMIASREKQHGDRVPQVSKYQTRILPLSTIYGGNASGKTNFMKALHFAETFVVQGTKPDGSIQIEPFVLDSEMAKRPSRFVFELLIDELIYEFSFMVTRKKVVEEKLILITSTSERVLYHRQNDKITLNSSLKKNKFLQFVSKGTRENQLFLTTSMYQNVELFLPVYTWFRDTLVLLAPDSRFAQFEQYINESDPLYQTMNRMLIHLDTGITHLGGETMPFNHLPFPQNLKETLMDEVKEGTIVRIMDDSNHDRYIVTRENNELIAKKIITYHSGSMGEVKFEMHQESDGSKRIIDLLPAFLELMEIDSKKVYVIDELDRSLHTLLTRRLLSIYLSACSKGSRSQLIFSTHDVLLMDQQLLRRDEMWVTEREDDGNTVLIPFSEFKDIRYDKDIMKSYLQGRLGGIPKILLDKTLLDSECNKGET